MGYSESYGDTGNQPRYEDTPCRPHSQRTTAKAVVHRTVTSYRRLDGLHACSGIFFDHAFPFRPHHFVTGKIVCGTLRVKPADGVLNLVTLLSIKVGAGSRAFRDDLAKTILRRRGQLHCSNRTKSGDAGFWLEPTALYECCGSHA